MMGIKITGLNKIQKDLNNLQRNAERLSKKKSLSFNELFTSKFMRRNTKFSSIDALLNDCGYGQLSQEEFKSIPQKELDVKISERTKFNSWQEMLNAAGAEYVSSQLWS
ncbi:MAG: hypothetical protein IJZ64_02945 [Ruminococcus sp.]|nr:hypothetical protein [Ruminococcus sp.]